MIQHDIYAALTGYAMARAEDRLTAEIINRKNEAVAALDILCAAVEAADAVLRRLPDETAAEPADPAAPTTKRAAQALIRRAANLTPVPAPENWTWCRHCGFRVKLDERPHPDSNPCGPPMVRHAEGGLYEYVGAARGAGHMRYAGDLEIYRGADTQLYYRTPKDFANRFKEEPRS